LWPIGPVLCGIDLQYSDILGMAQGMKNMAGMVGGVGDTACAPRRTFPAGTHGWTANGDKHGFAAHTAAPLDNRTSYTYHVSNAASILYSAYFIFSMAYAVCAVDWAVNTDVTLDDAVLLHFQWCVTPLTRDTPSRARTINTVANLLPLQHSSAARVLCPSGERTTGGATRDALLAGIPNRQYRGRRRVHT